MFKKTSFLIFLLFLFSHSFSYSQTLTVYRIEIEGNKSADKSLILLASGFTKGSPLELPSIQRAIKRIYALDLFSDVKLSASQTPEGVILTIKVKEYPKLVGLDIEGNKKFKKEEIEKKLNFKVGMQLGPQQVQEGINIIQALYKEKGYLTTKVKSELKPKETEEEIVLVYKIDEGKKVKIKK
ncbi:MAG: hypothetical protein MUO78_06890, partial [candidate division Zixibacteria bacterium]|nr:hypothetical protein [candidate division Zixibacteria bacterium]